MMLYCEPATGDGPDIVLLHGWGLHGGVWAGIAARLTASYRVWVPDLPGHGRSAPLPAVTLSDWADAVRAVVPAPAIWVGWSLGALVALAVAARAPQAVMKLALIGATPRFTTAPDWRCAVAPAVLAQFGEDLETRYAATLTRFLTLQFGRSDADRAALRRLRTMTVRVQPKPQALRTGLELLASTDLRPQLSAIAVPALVLHGSRDRLAPPPAAAFLARSLARARLETIDGAAHAPFLTHPDVCGAKLTEFLHG